jgi:phosphoribosyl 1,2-cyclic phosphodiesterase
MHTFTIRGSRGTVPVCGPQFRTYGGSTTCLSLANDDGHIIVDAGSGMSHIGDDFKGLGSDPPPMALLFTHFHMDHVVGLPCFAPIYRPEIDLTIMADPRRRDPWRDTLATFMGAPFWPIGIGETDAALVDLPVESNALELFGVHIRWFSLPHPQQCLAFRFGLPGADIVVATDAEYAGPDSACTFVDFCRGADILIFDAHFLPEEYEAHRGWGHSTWQTAAELATASGVAQLVLTHHAPERVDAQIDQIVRAARDIFPATIAAQQNLRVL